MFRVRVKPNYDIEVGYVCAGLLTASITLNLSGGSSKF